MKKVRGSFFFLFFTKKKIFFFFFEEKKKSPKPTLHIIPPSLGRPEKNYLNFFFLAETLRESWNGTKKKKKRRFKKA